MSTIPSKSHAVSFAKSEYIYRKSFVFVLDIIRFNELLKIQDKKSIANKLLLQATDFGEKIMSMNFENNKERKISLVKESITEAQKTKYLLQLCKYSENYPSPNILIEEIEELIDYLLKIK